MNKEQDGLLTLLSEGLQNYSNDRTAQLLGNRLDYIGLSDIGRYLECPRSAVDAKINSIEAASDLRKQLAVNRGHWFEDGVGKAISVQNLNSISQLEIDVVWQGVPVKAHLDFTLVWSDPQPRVRIVEVKSTHHLPAVLNSSYELQVYGQVSLLATLWGHPAFSIRDEHGKFIVQHQSFPEICKQQFGISMPHDVNDVDMEAWVLCLSMTDGKTFGPYLPHKGIFKFCLNSAKNFWNQFIQYRNGSFEQDNLPTAKGFHPLCSFCSINQNCPKFKDIAQTGLEPDLKMLAELKTQLKSLKDEIAQRESSIKTAYKLSDANGDWINAHSHRFRVFEHEGRRTLDKNMLTEKLNMLLGEKETSGLMEECQTQGRPYERLSINPINQKEKQDENTSSKRTQLACAS